MLVTNWASVLHKNNDFPKAKTAAAYHSPRNVYKSIPLLIFFVIFFCNFYGNSLRHRFFFCISHALLGESRGYCTKTKQEWPDSDQRGKIFVVIFTKLIPRRIFFGIAKILVLMVSESSLKMLQLNAKSFGAGCAPARHCYQKNSENITSCDYQEDGNGEKLTVKKWRLFGRRFFHGLVLIFSRFTPIFHGL